MKRNLLTMIVAALLIVAMSADFAQAQRPIGQEYKRTYAFEYVLDDSTATAPDTARYWTGTSSPIFWFDQIGNYGSLYGYLAVEYETLDTTAAGAVADTTKDTVYVDIYTSESDKSPYKLVATYAFTAIHSALVNGDYTWFNLSDSVLADAVYANVRTIIMDSTAAKVAASVGVNYKVHAGFWAK